MCDIHGKKYSHCLGPSDTRIPANLATDGGETAEHLYLLHVTRIQRQQKEAA